MAMAARIEDQRRANRVPVRLVTTHDGGNYPLTLLNVSTTGMLLSSPRPLHVGDEVSVDLPGLGATPAKVMWRDTDEYGCQFVEAIPDYIVAEVEAASRRNRSRQRQRETPPRRRTTVQADARRDDTRGLVALLVFLAFIVVLFYTGQALFVG